MIDYATDLNPAQYEAVTTLHGPVLVIAGAGSGKTRTIVYRLARLVESGVPASSILLLTFTRKAAREMLERARILTSQDGMPGLAESGDPLGGLAAVQGGTFHSYAYSVLRLFQPEGYGKNLTIMDSHDILAALQHCRDELKAGKGDRSFPKNQTIKGLISKSRNKEVHLEDIVRREAFHLLPHAETMEKLAKAYAEYKRTKNLLDYDDLLFAFEEALLTRPEALSYCRNRHQYLMVDEYQDTNPVQARLAGLVAGLEPGGFKPSTCQISGKEAHGPERQPSPVFTGNIMVVGDDAQSIYAFRGADVHNILRFPEIFPGTKIIRLEENYRSTQPLLDLSNAVLSGAAEGFSKHLFTRREGSLKPNIVRPMSEHSQANLVTARLIELMRQYRPCDIAVLFRAGFHSYALEVMLNKMGVAFRKYGGLRYTEAAHIKDVLSFARLVLNPLDFTAFTRLAQLSKGVGPRTCLKLYQQVLAGESAALAKATEKFPDFSADLAFIDAARRERGRPAVLLEQIVEQYRLRLEALYPDDYPRRLQGLEQLVQIANAYADLDLFISDLSLEDPVQEEEEQEDAIVLSTIHSAKGLEWSAVIILDLVEDRFPSRHALSRPEDFEEERRLLYVACTRAREFLEIHVPASIFEKGGGGNIPAAPSPFVRELSPELYVEWQEGYSGGLAERKRALPEDSFSASGKRGAGADLSRNGIEFPGKEGPGGFPPEAPQEGGRGTSFLCAEEPPTPGQGKASGVPPEQCGYCRHRIFGRGKIVQHLPPDKVRVNFPGVGLKVIMSAYLSMEG